MACSVLAVNAMPAGINRHVLQKTDVSDGPGDALGRLSALGIAEHAKKSRIDVVDAPALLLTFSGSIPKLFTPQGIGLSRLGIFGQSAR